MIRHFQMSFPKYPPTFSDFVYFFEYLSFPKCLHALPKASLHFPNFSLVVPCYFSNSTPKYVSLLLPLSIDTFSFVILITLSRLTSVTLVYFCTLQSRVLYPANFQILQEFDLIFVIQRSFIFLECPLKYFSIFLLHSCTSIHPL